LGAALYKDKLRAMIDMMKISACEIIRNKWMKAKDGKIDVVKETTNLLINMVLCCLFGSDKGSVKIIQRNKGKEDFINLGESMI